MARSGDELARTFGGLLGHQLEMADLPRKRLARKMLQDEGVVLTPQRIETRRKTIARHLNGERLPSYRWRCRYAQALGKNQDFFELLLRFPDGPRVEGEE